MQQLQDQQQTYTIVERILMQIFFQNFWLPRHPKHWFITFWEIELPAYETHVFKLNYCLSHILNYFYAPQMFWLALDTGESLLDIPERRYKGITHWYTNFTNHCLCYTDGLLGCGYKRITLWNIPGWEYKGITHWYSNSPTTCVFSMDTQESPMGITHWCTIWCSHGSHELTMGTRTNKMGKTLWDSLLMLCI